MAPALAVDGEILIDQAKVNAGGITPGDAPGFPATLSRPGRYKLTGNLAVPADLAGIVVTQHNVTIDLNGFTISSNPPGEAVRGVSAVNMSGLRVMNGTITGFGEYGIYNPADVEDMRIVSNSNGIRADVDVRIRNSTIANGDIGIECISRCLIEQNIISGNTMDGVDAYAGGLVLGNAVVSNGGYGLLSVTASTTGYGNSLLFRNNPGGAQVNGSTVQLHPNTCQPACP
jgi:hypothetical protein